MRLSYKVFEQITTSGYDNNSYLIAMFYQPCEAIEYAKKKAKEMDYDHFKVWVEDEERVVNKLEK